MESNPYKQFKRILIDAWPNGKAYNIAVMAMIDFDISWTLPNKDLDFEAACKFVQGINMPCRPGRFITGNAGHLMMEVSVYIAAFYPRTSVLLFDGGSKDVAYACFLQEGKRPLQHKGQKKMRKRESDKQRSFITIRARTLNKRHDWKTVK